MEVFRIVREKYANGLFASGAANRWNKEGDFVIYAGSSRSLSTLELVVHRNAVKPDLAYKVMVISIPDDDRFTDQINPGDLPADWRYLSAYPSLQKRGTDWYESRKSLLFRVPSAVLPKEFNYIINTQHPDYQEHVSLAGVEDYFWDMRLFDLN